MQDNTSSPWAASSQSTGQTRVPENQSRDVGHGVLQAACYVTRCSHFYSVRMMSHKIQLSK